MRERRDRCLRVACEHVVPRALQRSRMLPALTVTRRLVPRRQLLLGALGILFALGGVASSLGGATPSAPPTAFADQLRPSSWAMTIPSAWLAAPPPRVRVGDTLDVLAVHPGDRAVTVPV